MRKWYVLMLGVLVAVSGCAAGYTRVSKMPEAKFRQFQAAVVPDLAGSDQVPEEAKKGISEKITKELLEEKVFAEVLREEDGNQTSGLLIKGQVVQYNPGSRAMRYLAGPFLGAGKGSIIVNIKFIDKASGREIAESSFEGEIRGGVFGGGFDDTYNKVATEVVQFIKANL
jgi:hypothetical protein